MTGIPLPQVCGTSQTAALHASILIEREPSTDRTQARRDDPRGCPVLLADESSCCGCDADAGR
jgi:hypothetical protein